MVNLEPRRTALSLFSGAGGFDLGIEEAGFDILGCVEIDKNCCDTLRLNATLREQSGKHIVCDDIRNVDAEDLRRALKVRKGRLDLLFGGPPCQSFSLIGKQFGLSDHRGMLVFEMPRFAAAFRPKVIVMEQVKGFLSAAGLSGAKGEALEDLITELKSLGYECNVRVLNARYFGVPQNRERVFLVASRMRRKFSYPDPTHGDTDGLFGLLPLQTVREALRGLGRPSSSADRRDDSHVDVTPSRDRERISYVAPGSCLVKSDAPTSIVGRLSPKDTTKFLRLSPNGQSNTLRCGEIFFHPTSNRYLTPREYMRIHTYPDDYMLMGPIRGRTGTVKNLDQHRQIANSVPPRLAEAIGKAVLNVLTDQATDK